MQGYKTHKRQRNAYLQQRKESPSYQSFDVPNQRLSDGRRATLSHDRVDLLVKVELEVLAKLLLHGSGDSLEDVLEDTEGSRVVLVVVTTLEDTSADKASVPAVHVTTDDIGSRVVTNHVDVGGQLLVVVDSLHPGSDDLVGVLVGSQFGLTVDNTLEFNTGERLVHGLETNAEGSLGHTGEGVLSRAQHVTLREVDGDALGDGVRSTGSELAVLRLEKVHDDLDVGGVVAAVREDHDGFNVDLAEVARAGSRALLIGEDTVRGDGRVPGNDVVGDNNVLEAVLLSDLTALVALSTDNEDGLVVLGQGTHGSVRLDELLGRDGVVENLGELVDTGLLRLTRSVGEEDVGDLDAELVVSVQDLEDALTLGDETVTVDEDTVNVEDEGHVLSGANLLASEVLELSSDDVAGWLDRGHARADSSTTAIGVVNG